MGLLDYLFDPTTYGGQGGLLSGLQGSLINVPPSQGFPQQQGASFADRFQPAVDNPLAAAPAQSSFAQRFQPAQDSPLTPIVPSIGVGSYQMPRIGNMADFTPQQANPAALPQNAQPTQGQLPSQMAPQAPQQPLPPAFGPQSDSIGGNALTGLQSFLNGGGLISSIRGAMNGQRVDPAGMAQQNLKAQYDSLRSALEANGEKPSAAASKAMIAVMNPEAAKTIIPELFTSREKWADIGPDPATGVMVKGFVNERDQTINGKPVGAAQTSQSSALGDPTLTGDAYLQTLPEGMRSQVKAIVEGRMSPPSGFALKSPQIQALMRAAAQYEPGFDLTKWGGRAATAKDFASGAAAKNVTSLNTVVGHLADLKEKSEALGNYNSGFGPLTTTVNQLGNAYNNASGRPEVNNFNLARNAVADELAKVFKGSGISDHEIAQWKGTLNDAMTPDQLKGAVKTAIGLMDSRLSALNDQRDRGMSTQTDPRSLLNEKSRAGLAKIEEWANGDSTSKSETKAGGVSEGATATNPQTGQKIVFKGGKWVPAQ